MRLIDGDALREVLETAVQITPITQQYNKADVIRAIMDAPTIAHGTDSIMIKWTPDLDKLARDVAFRGLNEFSFLGKSIAEWAEIILEQPGWISVKYRLPEEKMNPYTQDYQEVICLLSTRFGNDVRVYKFGRGHFWNGPCEIDKYITHWMPLPAPPKEEEE